MDKLKYVRVKDYADRLSEACLLAYWNSQQYHKDSVIEAIAKLRKAIARLEAELDKQGEA